MKTFEEIKTIYEKQPKDIDTKAVEQGNPIQKRWHEIKFDATVKAIENAKLQEGSTILDVACGSGGLTFKLAKRFPELIFYGCDFNKHAVAFAEHKAYEKSISNVYIDCFSVESLGYKPESFDLLLALDALDHFFNPEKALSEMHRVLKEDGTLVLIVGNYKSFWSILEKLLDCFWKQSRNCTETHLTHFNMGSLWRMVYDIGFDSVSVGTLHLGMSLFCVARKGVNKNND